jgi:hypothetical protein
VGVPDGQRSDEEDHFSKSMTLTSAAGLGLIYSERFDRGSRVNEELQRRALAVALRHAVVVDGDFEEGWDELWLHLGEELGWDTVGKIDGGVLREQIRIAVESERFRQAGWSLEKIEAHQAHQRLQALVVQSRLEPGEVFNIVDWVGPLLRLKRTIKGTGFWSNVTVWDFDERYWQWVQPASAQPEQIESMLTALGAPPTCRALQLRAPDGDDWFQEGSKLPLRQALEIAVDLNDCQDQILLCLPGRLAYIQTHHCDRAIVYRPSVKE